MPLDPGTRVAHYEILAPVGAGGMGEVYRARDTVLKRDVALKVLPAILSREPDRLARFQCEAEILASLNHPGNLTISAPVGRRSLGTNQVFQFQLQMMQGTGRIQARGGVFNAEGFNIGGKSLFKVGDCFLFGFAFAVGRNVGDAGREPT